MKYVALVVSVLFGLMFGLLILLTHLSFEPGEVPCYDNKNNVIQGVTCMEESNHTLSFIILVSLWIFLFFIFIGVSLEYLL